jgi:phosphohistidine phosphatase
MRSSYGERAVSRGEIHVKSLYLLRHAKAAAGKIGQEDHARPLTGRGRRAADRIGDVLEQRGEPPDFVLCSSSRRTRETLERVLDRMKARPRVLIESDLYLADCETLLERVRALPDDAAFAMLVGHNPGIADLADALVTRGSRESRQRLAHKFPTGALAILHLDIARWDETESCAELADFIVPRELDPD